MVIATASILSTAQKSQLTAIQSTARLIDNVQLRLASGLAVNSAFEDPQNFFSSQALKFRSSDLSRRLDGIGTSIRTVQEADNGAKAILELLDLAQSTLEEAFVELYSDSDIETLKTELDGGDIARILNDNPNVVYSAQTESFYQLETTDANATTARANALARTINGVGGHLVNITSAQENAYVQGLITQESWIGASDSEIEGRWIWSDGPEAGLNFYNGAAGGSVVAGEYENWSNNEPNDFNVGEDYAVIRTNGQWNDFGGPAFATANREYVIEWDKSLFETGGNEELAQKAREYSIQYQNTLEQIDRIVIDANYRGINLLANEDLETLFNEDGSSRLKTEGTDFTHLGLGVNDEDFLTRTGLNRALTEIKDAKETVRGYIGTLSNDLNIIKARETFVNSTIQALLSGSDDLTLIDQNEVGAQLLALQVRQEIQFNTLAFGAQTEASIANFI